MWRYNLSYVAVALLSSVLLVVLAPKAGFIEDLAMMGLGFVAIFLLGNEVFLRALLPTEEETRGIDILLKKQPKWERHLIWIGAASGFISVMVFFIVARKTESFLPVCIPIAVFVIPFIIIQYVLPKFLWINLNCVAPTPELMELWGRNANILFIGGGDDDAWLAEEDNIPMLKEFLLRNDILPDKLQEIISALTMCVIDYYDDDLELDEKPSKPIVDDLEEFFKKNRALILGNTDHLALDFDAYLHWLLGDPYPAEDLPKSIGKMFGKES